MTPYKLKNIFKAIMMVWFFLTYSTKVIRTHYEELGVPDNATADDIKKAFITKSKEVTFGISCC